MVSLHGFTLDHRSMVGCLEPIFKQRQGWQRVYLDLPGHGQTPGLEWIQSSDDVLELIFDFIDAVIPDKQYVVAGLSYGGYLTRGLVNRNPDRVDGVLLIVPRIVSDPQARALPEKKVIARDEELLAELSPSDRADFEDVAVVQTREHWQRISEEIKPAVNVADKVFLERLNPRTDDFSFAIDSPSFTFEKPTLIVVGRQDHWVGYRDAWNILENYPRGTFAVLDRAGHALPLEQSVLFTSLVHEWLDRVEECCPINREFPE
jgi:pimeloyl-ACP methyl ester carboxylesterase